MLSPSLRKRYFSHNNAPIIHRNCDKSYNTIFKQRPRGVILARKSLGRHDGSPTIDCLFHCSGTAVVTILKHEYRYVHRHPTSRMTQAKSIYHRRTAVIILRTTNGRDSSQAILCHAENHECFSSLHLVNDMIHAPDVFSSFSFKQCSKKNMLYSCTLLQPTYPQSSCSSSSSYRSDLEHKIVAVRSDIPLPDHAGTCIEDRTNVSEN